MPPTPDSDRLASFKLSTDATWTVAEFASFLTTFREAYAVIGYFLSCEPRLAVFRGWDFPERLAFVEDDLRHAKDPVANSFEALSPSDELVIKGISIASPGWVDVIGKLNPLQIIKDIIVIFRDWKSSKDRARIENQIKEVELIKQKIRLMEEAHFTAADIKRALGKWLWQPTQALSSYVNNGLVKEPALTPLNPQAAEGRPASIDLG